MHPPSSLSLLQRATSKLRAEFEHSQDAAYYYYFNLEVFGCLICGWWKASARKIMGAKHGEGGDSLFAAIPTLQELDTRNALLRCMAASKTKKNPCAGCAGCSSEHDSPFCMGCCESQ